jgi:hypothetical protein
LRENSGPISPRLDTSKLLKLISGARMKGHV